MTLIGSLPEGTTSPAPEIQAYLPADPASTIAGIIILPGGGYNILADHEGQGYAEFFTQFGFACFVVNYRLGSAGHRHPCMLEDALAAMHTVRQRADEFHLDVDKIGIMGSSAGGHLAAHALTAHATIRAEGSLHPAFGILCYPVIDMVASFRHTSSCKNLLGPEPTEEEMKAVSPQLHVTPDVPPCFVWHTAEDASVPAEHSLGFAQALRQRGVPCDLHIYAKGGHGLGLNAPFPWGHECARWLAQLWD